MTLKNRTNPRTSPLSLKRSAPCRAAHFRAAPRRKGAAAVMAMVFLTLFGTLSVAMISLSTLNAQSAGNLADVERARSIAEAGLRWQAFRFKAMPRPRTLAVVLSIERPRHIPRLKAPRSRQRRHQHTIAQLPITKGDRIEQVWRAGINAHQRGHAAHARA